MKALLTGRTAIVTGGSMGIGKAIAEMFVQEGANVIITARRKNIIDETVAEIEAKGYEGKIIGVAADSAVEADAENVFKTAIDTFGKVDVMVNNAGISNRFALDVMTNDEWDSLINVNLTGPMYYIRLALKHMLERGEGGSIITVSSAMGVRCAGGAAYVTSKAGIIGLTKNIAFRGVDHKIRANTICPGHVETPMAQAVRDQMGADPRLPMSQITNNYVYRKPELDVDADQIAYAALYLASDMSRHVTGQTITVDNGMFMPF
ncbi:MAG: SDR family oxidoreductase [Firmicutes bacterium]|nr:SDR family oxidoreductase [Bacillota bacterium]